MTLANRIVFTSARCVTFVLSDMAMHLDVAVIHVDFTTPTLWRI